MDFENEQHAIEIVPGFVLGGLRCLREILDKQPDVLVPLDRLPGHVWECGFRGEILYYPITDYGVLPRDVLENLVRAILERLNAGKRVALFCAGGHGRTGYVAACVLFQLGKENPIDFLRKNYSMSAVESEEQEQAVERFCFRHIAETYWHCKSLMRNVHLNNQIAPWEDPDVAAVCLRIREELGPRARFLIKRSGVLPMVQVLVEAPSEEQCERSLRTFLTVLRNKGYLADGSLSS